MSHPPRKPRTTVLFLIQAKAGLPGLYRCLKHKPHVLLSYQTQTAQTHLYAPDTTWTQGRNKLIEYVKANELIYDWYIFLDEDAVFYEMTQQDGFDMFLSVLESCDYPIITVRKERFNQRYDTEGREKGRELANIIPPAVAARAPENLRWEFQTVSWFDSMFNAFSFDAFFDDNLLPYSEEFDAHAWGLSGVVTMLRANHLYRNRIMQCNGLWAKSTQSTPYPVGDWSIYRAVYGFVLDQFGVAAIEMSDAQEIKLKVGYCRSPLFHLRCFCVKTMRRMQTHYHRGKGRLYRCMPSFAQQFYQTVKKQINRARRCTG